MKILEQELNKLAKEYFGDRYYDEYHRNPVRNKEYVELIELMYKAVETYKSIEGL